MKTYVTLLFLLYFSLSGLCQPQSAHTTDNGIKYLAYFPDHYQESEAVPLLLFLHGLGEKGHDLEIVKRHGPPKMIENGRWPSDLPFLVISPQLPMNKGYWPEKLVDEILEHLLATYKVDDRRIYLSGLSLGGIGTWNYASHHPEKLAAIIPVCGKGDPALACNLQDLPVWAFHGDQDGIVSPDGSKKMIAALKNCPNREPAITKFTLYPGVKHDSWTRTYNNREIYSWLLTHSNDKDVPKPSPTVYKAEPDMPKPEELKLLCRLPAAVKESSGLQFYKNGTVWTHNDSGNQPVIYQIDTTGKVKQFKTITNSANFDWEDLAKDNKGNLYIGDFGNNQNKRKSLQIYKIPNPEETPADRIKAEVITFTYPDQNSFPPPSQEMNFDMEAMIALGDHLFLFSKNRTEPFSGVTKIYKLPQEPGNYTATLVDSLVLNNSNMLENWITAADISPDGKKLVLLSSNKLWLIRNFSDSNFSEGDIITIHLPSLSQKEGITFINNTDLLISDELVHNVFGGNLYRLNLSSDY